MHYPLPYFPASSLPSPLLLAAYHVTSPCTLLSNVVPGGSVTPETVDELMACPDIDGALVGGASLVAEKFSRIVGFKAPVSA